MSQNVTKVDTFKSVVPLQRQGYTPEQAIDILIPAAERLVKQEHYFYKTIDSDFYKKKLISDQTREFYQETLEGLQEWVKNPEAERPLVYLEGANLVGAWLRDADLAGVDFTNANFQAAKLSSVDLTGATLRGADLRQSGLFKANLTRADLRDADLTGANLTRADLTEADLTKAMLLEAKLIQAKLIQAKLKNADLIGADLRGANLGEANLTDADFKDVYLFPKMDSLTREQLMKIRNSKTLRVRLKTYIEHYQSLLEALPFQGKHATLKTKINPFSLPVSQSQRIQVKKRSKKT
jgi:uncharacterized protein YjbI with pentapeptide repeats